MKLKQVCIRSQLTSRVWSGYWMMKTLVRASKETAEQST